MVPGAEDKGILPLPSRQPHGPDPSRLRGASDLQRDADASAFAKGFDAEDGLVEQADQRTEVTPFS